MWNSDNILVRGMAQSDLSFRKKNYVQRGKIWKKARLSFENIAIVLMIGVYKRNSQWV